MHTALEGRSCFRTIVRWGCRLGFSFPKRLRGGGWLWVDSLIGLVGGEAELFPFGKKLFCVAALLYLSSTLLPLLTLLYELLLRLLRTLCVSDMVQICWIFFVVDVLIFYFFYFFYFFC